MPFAPLYGLDDELSLGDQTWPQTWRVDNFIDSLREHREIASYLDLTLNSLLSKLILPDADKPLFVQMMKDKLKLTDENEPIADRL